MILIVDDMQEIVEWLVATVQEAGYYADCATDFSSALYKMQRICYSLSLIDIRLPGAATGNDLARRVKSLPEPFCNVPLVAMTGSRLTAEDGLFVAVLSKPFLPRDLRNVIAAHANTPIQDLHISSPQRASIES